MVGGVLCVPDRAHGHPTHPFFLLHGAGVVWGLCGVVDVGDELLCFVDQGVAEESGTRQQHQHNTSPPVRDTSRA